MKNLLSILMISVLVVSCNNGAEDSASKKQSEKIYQIEDIMSSGNELADQNVSVTGMVVHVCKHGGQKMFISGENEEQRLLIRVTKSIPEFDIALEGSSVEVTGKVVATVVTEACSGEGEEHKDAVQDDSDDSEKTEGEEEDCAFEKTDAKEVITYHIEATSFKEITK